MFCNVKLNADLANFVNGDFTGLFQLASHREKFVPLNQLFFIQIIIFSHGYWGLGHFVVVMLPAGWMLALPPVENLPPPPIRGLEICKGQGISINPWIYKVMSNYYVSWGSTSPKPYVKFPPRHSGCSNHHSAEDTYRAKGLKLWNYL